MGDSNIVIVAYESDLDNTAYFITKGKICFQPLMPFAGYKIEEQRNPLWGLMCGITLWVIWKCRCVKVFTGKAIPPAEGVKEIWSAIIHSLKGQYNSIKGDSDTAVRRRLSFLQSWASTPFFFTVEGSKPH